MRLVRLRRLCLRRRLDGGFRRGRLRRGSTGSCNGGGCNCSLLGSQLVNLRLPQSSLTLLGSQLVSLRLPQSSLKLRDAIVKYATRKRKEYNRDHVPMQMDQVLPQQP